jgi:molybdopterin/thiamine biosynthesis adenylyltransferase
VGEKYKDHPELTRDGVLDAIDQLVGTGYFEDAATEPAEPSAEARYSRSAAYYSYIDRTPRESIVEVQRLITGAHVTVLGVGGLGSAAAYSLAASGIGGLTLVDPDIVELSNLNRQVLYTTRDIGRPKVEAAAARLAELRPDLHLETRQARVTTEAAVQDLFAESRLIVQCADTPVEIEQWCNRSALRTGVAWVNGAYDGPHVCVTLYQPGAGPCWRCMRLDHYDRDPVPGDFSGTVHMATAATTNIAGNLAAHVALAALTAVAAPSPGVPVVWNTVRLGHAFTVPVQTRADCPDCSVDVRLVGSQNAG